MYCKNCGTLIAMGVTRCHACGANQASEGKIIMPGGSSFNSNGTLNQTSNNNKINANRNSNFKGIIFVAVVLSFMALIVFLKVFNN